KPCGRSTIWFAPALVAILIASGGCTERKLGQPCTSDRGCQSRLCFRFQERDAEFCSRLCYCDSDCPSSMVCLAGYDKCVPKQGKELGASCDRQLECSHGICIRVTDPTTRATVGYCSQMCRTDRDCPTPFQCRSRKFKLRTGLVVLKNYCSRQRPTPQPKPVPTPKPLTPPIKPTTRISL
ncbi:MAG: hypothetical protein KC609_19350, partial [Myxococcales bacterium]|nr:hypothetical protein [Myxococcales bacterium]